MGDVFGSERARVDLHVVANVTLGFRTAGGSRRNHACTARFNEIRPCGSRHVENQVQLVSNCVLPAFQGAFSEGFRYRSARVVEQDVNTSQSFCTPIYPVGGRRRVGEINCLSPCLET